MCYFPTFWVIDGFLGRGGVLYELSELFLNITDRLSCFCKGLPSPFKETTFPQEKTKVS